MQCSAKQQSYVVILSGLLLLSFMAPRFDAGVAADCFLRVIFAESEGLMVMGKCEGEQHTWQVAQRSPLAWAALSGCGYRNTWVECLKDSNAQLRKDLSKQLINFAVRCFRVAPSHCSMASQSDVSIRLTRCARRPAAHASLQMHLSRNCRAMQSLSGDPRRRSGFCHLVTRHRINV